MSYLISQMLPCLLLAGLIGAIIGWLLKRGCNKRSYTNHVRPDIVLAHDNSENIEIQNLTSDFDDKIDSKNREILQLKSQMQNDYDLKLKDIELISKNSNNEMQILRAKLDEGSSAQQEIEVLKAKLLRVEHSSSDSDKEIHMLRDSLDIAKSDASNSTMKLTAMQNDYDLKLKDIKSVSKTSDEEMQAINIRLANVNLVEHENKSLKEKLINAKSIINDSNQELQLLRNKLTDTNLSEREIESLKAELKDTKLSVLTSATKLSAMQNEYNLKLKDANLASTDSDIREIQTLKAKLEGENSTQQEIEALKVELKDTRSTVLTSATKFSAMQNEYALKVEDANLAQKEIGNLKIELNNAQLNISDSNTKLSSIQNDYELKLKDTNLALTNRDQEIQTLKTKLSDIETSITVTTKPQLLKKPNDGGADNLQLIKGVGGKLNGVLNDLGIYHFSQIASWREKEVNWVNDYLAFSGRIQREEWIRQAKELMMGKETEFAKRVKKGEVSTSDNIELATAEPEFLEEARVGGADNLQLIKGVGSTLNGVLNDLGIYHFDQIASWNKKEINWVNDYLAFSGRIEREEWIRQAKELMAGKETEFAKRVKQGEVPTSDATQNNNKNRIIKHSKKLRKK